MLFSPMYFELECTGDRSQTKDGLLFPAQTIVNVNRRLHSQQLHMQSKLKHWVDSGTLAQS
jgi:hypothetical protein